MKFTRLTVIAITLVWLLPLRAHADIADELQQLEGWCIVATKTISGYIDSEGAQHDDFEGCEHGRQILFVDGTYLTCNDYGYNYSYWPDAVIFARSFETQGKSIYLFKMLVEDEIYDMIQ